jgi:HAD superfamily hydrolase (TIGR01509 family)
MMIRGILFDAAGVLYDRPESTSRHVSRLLAGRGLPTRLPAQDWLRVQDLRSRAKSGQISPEEYWDRRLQMHGLADPEERRVLAGKVMDYADQVRPIPGGKEALAGLRQRGFVLGIVTDTIYPIERKMRWLDQVGVAEFLDVVACSTAVGAHKPDPAIYLKALEQAGLAPGESAFVGHAADELEGARRAGLATVAVLYEPHAQADYYAGSPLDLLHVPIFQRAYPRKARA